MSLVIAHRNNLSRRVRAFMQWIEEVLTPTLEVHLLSCHLLRKGGDHPRDGGLVEVGMDRQRQDARGQVLGHR